MNIFVIAPTHDDLPDVSREIAAIARCHDAEVLRGMVRDLDISEKLDQLENDGFVIDVIWWITHGGADGVLLSDGMLDTQGSGQYVKKSGAHLCVFNTCDSEEVALSIVAGSEADMIYTVGDVKNRVAVRFGILLAPALANTEDCRAAYDAVAPAGGPYRYLEAKAHYRRHFMSEMRDIDERAMADRTRIQVMIIILYLVLMTAAVGVYREVLNVEQNQIRILQEIRDVEQRIIQMQMDTRPTPSFPYSDPEKR